MSSSDRLLVKDRHTGKVHNLIDRLRSGRRVIIPCQETLSFAFRSLLRRSFLLGEIEMKRQQIDIRLLKHMNRDKAYLCQRMFSRLKKVYGDKERIAKSKTGGSPWRSLTDLCRDMGFKNHMGSRYLVMDLKKKLTASGLVMFDNSIVEGERRASRFAFIAIIEEKAMELWDQYRDSFCICGEESQNLNSHGLCSCWNGLFDPNVIAKLAVS